MAGHVPMMCDFKECEDDPRRKECTRPRCKNYVITDDPPERCYATCRGKPGLGDYVAKGLAMFGIRKKTGCGCKERQRKLNELGARVGL